MFGGVCGKKPETANLQDLLIYVTKGLSEITTRLRSEDKEVPAAIDRLITTNLFMTITNANFDDDRFIDRINATLSSRDELLEQLHDDTGLSDAASWQYRTAEERTLKADKVGVLNTGNEDLRSLRELVLYGLKGMAAYNKHANVLGHADAAIDAFLQKALAKTLDDSLSADDLTSLVLETGSFGVKVMALLDTANTSTYGNPEITKVELGVRNNPAILISGHDLRAFSFRARGSRSMRLSLALLPAAVCVVIMMVNGNVGAGVAVAGAFSLVRFRSVPGTAKEIGTIFLAMAAGLIAGMGYLGFAVLFSLIMGAVMFVLNVTRFGVKKAEVREKTLRITIPEDLNYGVVFDTLFIVDEASMIANDGLAGAVFGTGRLLDDLIQYVYAGTGCRLMLIGDTAQLPPVGEEESPALSADKLRGYGMEVYEAQLTEVVRQMHDSGILWNATELRRYISEENFLTLPSVRVEGFPDIRMVSGSELIEVINDCYGQAGMDETIVVCRSNKRANIYNKGIRNTILFREDELNSGDLLMVAKNNYFWTEGCKEIDFIANGDIAVVRRVRRVREAYGFRFADVVLAFPDYDGMELEVKLLLDTLHTETPALPKELNDKLFYSVLEDYADITVKRERMKKMKADPHYNALQVKYAYAVTCHKAQGGQWKRVFLDQGYMTEDMLTPDYFRWLYTAFTRATEILYLVNWPKE